MSFGSDAGSFAPEGDFLKYNPHPRAYGNFAEPHQLATGVQHVFVNGTHVLDEAGQTGAPPGRVVRDPG